MKVFYKIIVVTLISAFGILFLQGCTVLNNNKNVQDKELHVNAKLTNTYWKLMSIEGTSVKVYKDMKEPYMLFKNDDKRVNGFSGCNNMFGSFKTDTNNIKIGPMATTRRACSHGMDTELKFHKIIEKTAKFEIYGETLKLKDETGKVLARFESRYFN